MTLDTTKRILSSDYAHAQPQEVLRDVLSAVVELLALDDNVFAWSSWKDSAAAVSEVNGLLALVESGGLPDRRSLAILFAPTGPIQEVSISSGWGDLFRRLAERYDDAASSLYP